MGGWGRRLIYIFFQNQNVGELDSILQYILYLANSLFLPLKGFGKYMCWSLAGSLKSEVPESNFGLGFEARQRIGRKKLLLNN